MAEHLNDRLWSWASILEASTLEQAERTARMPFVFPHVALMPDAHLGRGATVGSVIPTLGALMPAAVGVDIGCGMIAVRTQLHVVGAAGRPVGRPDSRSSGRCRCRPAGTTGRSGRPPSRGSPS